MPWTPHDLPFIAEKATAGYRDLAHFWEQQDYPDAEAIADGNTDSASMLDGASLTWLDSDMCDMLAGMWKQVPDWTPAACVPGSQGLMAFDSPIFTAPYETIHDGSAHPVPVRAIGWRVDGAALRLTAWSWSIDVPAHVRSPLRSGLDLEELLGITLPMEAVIDGAQVIERAVFTPEDKAFDDSALMMQSIAGAAWLVMSQPRIIEDSQLVAQVRKHTSEGRRVKTPVRVTIRSLVTTTRGKSTPTGRKATSRWWVRGHWRQQPWGKGRALRKPIFIAPHTAGNPDAPIDGTPTVQVWRTGDKNET